MTAGFKSRARLDSSIRRASRSAPVSPVSQNDLLNNGQVTVTPAADLRHFDVVQILTRPARRQRRAPSCQRMSDAVSVSLLRLVALAFLTVVIQEAAVSQVSIFGVSADLTPLVVMSVGLLAGSIPGAVMGFAHRPARRHRARADARRDLAAVHRHRLLVGAPARAA